MIIYANKGLLDETFAMAFKDRAKGRSTIAMDKDIQNKLAKFEALFARGATAGERAAAGTARDRLQVRIANDQDRKGEAETELQYSLPDVWSVRIFVALCRKHDIKPYRYPLEYRTG